MFHVTVGDIIDALKRATRAERAEIRRLLDLEIVQTDTSGTGRFKHLMVVPTREFAGGPRDDVAEI